MDRHQQLWKTQRISWNLPKLSALVSFQICTFFVISWQFSILHLMRTVDIVQSPQHPTFWYFAYIRIVNMLAIFGPLKQCRISHGSVILFVYAGVHIFQLFQHLLGLIYSNLHRLTIQLKPSQSTGMKTKNSLPLSYSSKNNGLNKQFKKGLIGTTLSTKHDFSPKYSL